MRWLEGFNRRKIWNVEIDSHCIQKGQRTIEGES